MYKVRGIINKNRNFGKRLYKTNVFLYYCVVFPRLLFVHKPLSVGKFERRTFFPVISILFRREGNGNSC